MNPHLVPAASYQSLDPDPLAVTEDELVERRYDLNAAIRRARPSVDSPLADWILGRITREEMDRRFAERDAREAAERPERLYAAGLRLPDSRVDIAEPDPRIVALSDVVQDMAAAYHLARKHDGKWSACQKPRCQNARLVIRQSGAI